MAEQKQDLQEEKKPEAEGEALSRKRRVALVTYLSILFAVAFLLVALSMVIENKHLQSTNAALEDSSKKTSANLNQTIEQMQNENDALTQKTAEQESQISAYEAEKAAAQTELEQLRADQEALMAEKESLAAEKESLSARAEEAEQKAADAVEVSELLQKAIAANEEGHYKTLKKLLEEIEPMKDLLSPSELDWYESLVIE